MVASLDDIETSVVPVSVPLAGDGRLVVSSEDGRAILRIESPGRQGLELSIELTETGPVVRARVAALEVQADRIALGCREFSVQAETKLELSSGGDLVQNASGQHKTVAGQVTVAATEGSVRVRANDDVQLLGEQLLLNCERTAVLPSWMPRLESGPAAGAVLPLAAASGDASLLRDLDGGPRATE